MGIVTDQRPSFTARVPYTNIRIAAMPTPKNMTHPVTMVDADVLATAREGKKTSDRLPALWLKRHDISR
jgi:hypothetical protein